MIDPTPEQLAKVRQIPDFERRLAEERAARDRAIAARQQALDARSRVEALLVKARSASLPELRSAAHRSTAQHLAPINRFFEAEGRRYIRLLGLPGIEQDRPQAYGVALEVQQLLDEWAAAVRRLAALAEEAAQAHAAHQQVAGPLEVEVQHALGGVH